MKTSLLSSSVCLGVEGSTSCLGASPPQGQRSFWETFPPQQKSCLQGQRDKSESQVPPAAAAVPRTASPQRQESAGQEKSTNASPPQQDSSTKKRDKPDPVKMESRAPPAAAAVTKPAPSPRKEIAGQETATKPPAIIQRRVFRNGWTTRKVSTKTPVIANSMRYPSKGQHPAWRSSPSEGQRPACRMPSASPGATGASNNGQGRSMRENKNTSPQRHESVGQEKSTKPAVAPAAPPQLESSINKQDNSHPAKTESQVPPAAAAVTKPASTEPEASTEAPVMAASPPQLESSTETLDMKDPPKPESQEPPAAAAVSETAPGYAVDTFKVSNKARRRMRKMRNS
ncbi:polycystic kidney disease protein 1-like 3 [Triplophysa rosa]|uniref:polycystic kidney disease protein 1-like 3 n=1 Tax=Triplophysa rosa TaxID=992332 RepID=UPI002546007A|nr:polycystic kidney disease protein 1-like 3 [Triplophysa rosa]